MPVPFAGDVSPYVQSALDRACKAIVDAAGKNQRHSTLAKEAYALGGLVGGGHLSRSIAEMALRSAVDSAWPANDPDRDRDGYRTLKAQLTAGIANPRSVAAPVSKGSAMPQPAPSPSPLPADVTPLPHSHLRAVAPDADPFRETIIGIKNSLLRTSSGSPKKIIANATTILSLDPRWFGVLAYQALSDRVVKLKLPQWHSHDMPSSCEVGPWTDSDTNRVQAWLSREYGLDIGADTANASIQTVAEKTWIDPLKDYFDGQRGKWDGVKRVDIWLSVIFNAENTPYVQAVGRRWLISAVARALRPGCKVDHVLILEGLQGKKKSTALEKLCPSPDLFFDSELNLGDKDAYQVLRGKFIVELGEVDKMNRHDLSLMKAFITRKIDTYRPSFGRRSVDIPRRFVLAGSTNEREYLKDRTGNRRWWPVYCPGPIDIPQIEQVRDQLWAEALTLFESGAPWWLESEELTEIAHIEQEARKQPDPWDEHVLQFIAKALRDAHLDASHASNCECCRCRGLTSTQILSGALSLPKEKHDKSSQMRVRDVLTDLGWTKPKYGSRQDGLKIYPYFPPTD